jgi:hypothetical protein
VLFRNGKRLLKQGKVAEACASFDASQKLDPTVSTLLNQANCRERNNQLATAWGLFLDAERDTRSAADDAGRVLHQVAVDHAEKLEPRLSTLEIRVSAEARPAGLEIRRDNEVVDPAAWNQQLPVDGGTYKITARAKGVPDWSMTVTVGVEKDAKVIEIPKPATAATATATATPHAPAVKTAAPPVATAKATAAPETWYCTASSFAKIGICKPQLDACEAFRSRMLAHVHDLPACAPAQSATCFQLAGDAHCAPSGELCDAMREGAERSVSGGVGACEAKRATKLIAKPAPAAAKATGKVDSVDFDDTSDAKWFCTSSELATVGTCKATREQCEAFRAKLLERYHDLSTCRGVASAHCFDLGKEPHCAPTGEICDEQRSLAGKQATKPIAACYRRASP